MTAEGGGSRGALTRFWPVFGLTVRTPNLVLRPLCDDDLAELIELALAGVHDPGEMPFAVPWTDQPADVLGPETLRFHWNARAANRPQRWSLDFAVRRDGVLVGTQSVAAEAFAVTRAVHTGSWLGARHQGNGIGTEMRCAVVMFAFDLLGAERAESSAFLDNPASLRVSEKLGYRPDGIQVRERRPGERAVNRRLLLEPQWFRRPDWTLRVAGLDACRPALGLTEH